MKLENDKCKIEISVDHTYRIGSADNKPYDKIFSYQGLYQKGRGLFF